jgi:acylphosphatase
MKCLIIKVSGNVQGVFFRASTKEQADLLGISGFVKNEKDGGVYIEAEGESAALNKFVEWCKVGPPQAVVTDVKISEVELRQFSSFKIVRW